MLNMLDNKKLHDSIKQFMLPGEKIEHSYGTPEQAFVVTDKRFIAVQSVKSGKELTSVPYRSVIDVELRGPKKIAFVRDAILNVRCKKEDFMMQVFGDDIKPLYEALMNHVLA